MHVIWLCTGITNQPFSYSPRFHNSESDGLHYVVQIPTFKHHPSRKFFSCYRLKKFVNRHFSLSTFLTNNDELKYARIMVLGNSIRQIIVKLHVKLILFLSNRYIFSNECKAFQNVRILDKYVFFYITWYFTEFLTWKERPNPIGCFLKILISP